MTDIGNLEERFAKLFDEHHHAIQVYCFRRLPRNEVNDASSEVFLVAWRRIATAPNGRELPWLYGIARNVVRNAHRSQRRYGNLKRKASGTRGAEPVSPEAQIVQRDEDAAVLRALDALSHSDQEILRLRTWEELSTQEIASVLGISPRAVEVRVSRARKRLSRTYEKQTRQSPIHPRPRFVEEGGER